MEVLLGVESVLFEEKKSSTFKFALVSAIMDYIIENPSEYPENGFHTIPIIYLAKQWLFYYYPLMVYGEKGVRQGNVQIALHKMVEDFINSKSTKKIICSKPEVILKIKDQIESDNVLEKELVSLLLSIRKKIVEQPLQYIQIAGLTEKKLEIFKGIKVKDQSFTLFGLINTTVPLEEHTNYQKIREKSERWVGTRKESSWSELESNETAYIQLGHFTYTELSKSRFFIKDAIIKRWFEFTIETYLKSDAKAIHALFHGLYLHTRVPERDRQLMILMRDIAEKIFKPMKCIYCDEETKSFDLDHFIPWSKFPVDKFWNLFPSCKSCNSKKSDNVVELEQKIEQRLVLHLRKWLQYFQKNRELLSKLGGKEVNYIKPESLEKSVDILVEHIREIQSSL